MPTYVSIHSSDIDPEGLRRTLAEFAKYEQMRAFRKLLLRRLAVIAFVVWILSWPAHLLPHIALWVALAIVVLAAFLISPTPPAIPGTRATHR